MVGLIKSDLGSILLNDKNISHKPMYERAKLGIGYLAQEASVFRKLTVEDNIRAVLEIGSLSKLDQNKKLEELIEEFSLQRVRKNRGDLLSGGREGEQRLQEHWQQIQSSYFLMNLLQELIQLQLKKFKKLFFN